MDFKAERVKGMEEFRKEVWEFYEKNIPKEMINSPGALDNRDITLEELRWAREFWRKLGDRGWLDPLAPPEYSNGHKFTLEQAIAIDETESDFRDVVGSWPSPADLGVSLGVPALMVYGTEEQKQRFLTDILGGRVITWQLFTEPGAGTDLAGCTSTAVWSEEERVWIVNGSKQFGGGPFFPPDLMPHYGYGPFVTEPNAPRHRNLTAFLIPMNLPGATPNRLDMLSGGWRDLTFFENVRVPDIYRIGERGQGWLVINATLEREHGGGGSALRRSPYRDALFALIKERGWLRDDPEGQEELMDYFLIGEVSRLFNQRNYWMRTSHQRWAWEGSQNAEWSKANRAPQEDRLLDIIGPHVLLDYKDPDTLLRGRVESAQRAVHAVHAGGTIEAQKIIMGRRIGIGQHVPTQAQVVA